MTFGPVTLEFTRLECVQQSSIITEISFTTFARGRQYIPTGDTARHRGDQKLGLFHYCSPGETLPGRAGGLHATLCHTFLVCLEINAINITDKINGGRLPEKLSGSFNWLPLT